jgi:uncharacterized membrane protein YdbT with pleckstrin-like domain
MSGMLYVQQSLSPGEELVYIGRFHWMYTLQAIMGIIWGILGCVGVIAVSVYFKMHYGTDVKYDSWIEAVHDVHPGLRLGAFFVFIMGLLRFAQMMVVRASTEIAITSSRLIYKRGLVARYVGEMNIDRIEGVNVLQTVMGRIFGYGRIMVRGLGVGEVILPPLANPIDFRKAIEKAKVTS